MDYFSHQIGNVIIPTDELIFFRGVVIPPTRYVYATLKVGMLPQKCRTLPREPAVLNLGQPSFGR